MYGGGSSILYKRLLITMDNYFHVNYEMDRGKVHDAIGDAVRQGRADYICVADGVVLNMANRDAEYMRAVNGGMFVICDSSYVPIYLRLIYGRKYSQYCGADIFKDIVGSRKYRMMFMGTSDRTLAGLRDTISGWNPDVRTMEFYELPFRTVDGFDYADIARRVEESGADIIWVALGAPKQELFMARLKPHLKRGVMIAVGAVFKFYSTTEERRAPKWMVRGHMEFVFRIMQSPKKQLSRCGWIIRTLPGMLWEEWRRSRKMARKGGK